MASSSPPVCFGQRWEAHHPECAGGLDPAYSHPRTKSHKRDKCQWYSSCASRTASANLGTKLISPQQLVRHQQPQHSQMPPMPQPFQNVVRSAQPQMQYMQQAIAQTPMAVPQMPYQQMMQPAPQPFVGHAQPMMVHPAAASMPWAVPMNYASPGMQAPAFLTVPEPLIPGQSLTRPFMATMGRTLLKALGMSAANWFDHVPWNPWPYPQQNYSAPPTTQTPST